jgi:hypothetical protein
VWHGKGRKALPRLRAIYEEIERRTNQDLTAMCWNLRKAHGYLRSNAQYLVNYASRYRKGLPISSAIAESAVNQVVSIRMTKKQQMRWSDQGAHHLALLRVADLNGKLSARSFGRITQPRRSVVDRLFYGSMELAA